MFIVYTRLMDFYTKSDIPEYIGDFEGIANGIEEAIALEIKCLQSKVEEQSMKWLIRKLLKQVVKLYFFVYKECYCLCLGSKNPKYDYTVKKNIYLD